MVIEPKPAANRNAHTRQVLRGGAALLVVAILLGGLLLLVDFEEERPDFYQPARAPLTDAAMILSETYAEEKELAQKLQTVHSRLDDAIALLDRAERLDPEDKRQIETLQVQLRALEDTDRLLSTDPKSLQRTYRNLVEQINALADKLVQPRS
jgi:DNA repair exonuclease SbcCD ATPase subunit